MRCGPRTGEAHAGQSFETARVHHAHGRCCGGGAATHSGRAAIGAASDRISSPDLAGRDARISARFSPGIGRCRLYRGQERRHRIPVGGGRQRSAAEPDRRIGPPSGIGDRDAGEHVGCARGQGGDQDDPDHLHAGRRPGADRPRRLSHPGGNLTGIHLFLAEVAAKRLEFLLPWVPGARSVAYLRSPTNPVFAESETSEVEAAARSFGVKLVFFNASDSTGIERAFREIAQQRMETPFVSADGFLLTHSEQIVTLASWTAVPAAYGWRPAVTRGGLMSYGTDFHDSWRQAGIYTGRVLKGEKPIALPVPQGT